MWQPTPWGRSTFREPSVAKVDFPETDVCSAMGFGKYVCGDYDSGEEELRLVHVWLVQIPDCQHLGFWMGTEDIKALLLLLLWGCC